MTLSYCYEKVWTYQKAMYNEAVKKSAVLSCYTHCSSEYGHSFYSKDSEIEIIEKSTGQRKKIKWKVLVEKKHTDTNFLQPHVPNINTENRWQRRIYPN